MLFGLLQTIVLIMNAMAILNQKRFLKKYGFDTSAVSGNSPNEVISSKNQLIMFVFTVRTYGKFILIPLNLFIILVQVIM